MVNSVCNRRVEVPMQIRGITISTRLLFSSELHQAGETTLRAKGNVAYLCLNDGLKSTGGLVCG